VTAYGTWVPYAGPQTLLLSAVLLAVAVLLTYLGRRLRGRIAVMRPGKTVSAFLIVIWALSIWMFLVALFVYAVQLHELHLLSRPPKDRIAPITVLTAAVTFCIIFYMTRRYGWKAALGSAFVGAAAAPMMFELPFDLVVFSRTIPSIPPSPTLYRLLFFLPLFLAEISTLALLTLLPTMRVSRYTLYSLAAMFFIFAVWALFGFHYPNAPIPYALNAASKITSFVSVITLFADNTKRGNQQSSNSSPP
jgi:hypothetical protein